MSVLSLTAVFWKKQCYRLTNLKLYLKRLTALFLRRSYKFKCIRNRKPFPSSSVPWIPVENETKNMCTIQVDLHIYSKSDVSGGLYKVEYAVKTLGGLSLLYKKNIL